MQVTVNPSKIGGTVAVPSSKSHSIRAIIFASMAYGKSCIYNILDSPDISACIKICQLFGAKIKQFENKLEIEGVGGDLLLPNEILDVGNSGLCLRFFTAISTLVKGKILITGDQSIRSNRTMQDLIDAINMLDAKCYSKFDNGFAPIVIDGRIAAGRATLSGEDSQPVSAMLIACAFMPGTSEIIVKNPGELPWIDVTLSWLMRLGAKVENYNYQRYIVSGKQHYDCFDYFVPGDFSSLAFPLVAALISQQKITIKNVDLSDSQGDKLLLDILKDIGANLSISPNEISLFPSPELKAIDIDVNPIIDALPILAVLGCYLPGRCRLYNAQVARTKESDRLACITTELLKMGAKIVAKSSELLVTGSKLVGAELDSHNDHRIAMALAVAAHGANGPSKINNFNCVNKTYANFIKDMNKLGGSLV